MVVTHLLPILGDSLESLKYRQKKLFLALYLRTLIGWVMTPNYNFTKAGFPIDPISEIRFIDIPNSRNTIFQ